VLYGYDFAGDPAQHVEWVNLRVTGIGPIERPRIAERPLSAAGTPPERSTRAVCFDAEQGYVEAPVHWRPDLAPGHVVTGPAVVEEYGSTVPLHPGWTARVDGFGNLLLTRATAPRTGSAA
jgi:N-methylhydantoinase A